MKQDFKQMSILKYNTHETMLVVEIDDKNMIIIHRWMRCDNVNEIMLVTKNFQHVSGDMGDIN
jgi:hypothetical protein